MKIKSLDRLVLTVRDIEATCLFYCKVLGMETIMFGDNRKSLKFGKQKKLTCILWAPNLSLKLKSPFPVLQT